jgi:DNA-binding LacI/PurR family transcriptional regulator
MVVSDREVFTVAAALRSLGVEPGRDARIVGYDNYWSDCIERSWEPFEPDATVDKLNRRTGADMVELLLERAAGQLPPEPQLRVVAPRLIVNTRPPDRPR